MNSIQKEINNEKLTFELVDNPTIEDLKCCICLELVNKPQVANCNHFFCKTCIRQYFDGGYWKNCPMCKDIIHMNHLKPFFLVETLISKFSVKCSEKNCSEITNINNIENHINNHCNYYEKECQFNCGSKFNKKDICQHETRCLNNPTVEINCNKCNEKIFAINFQKHLQESCLEEFICCKFGCKKKIKRKNITEHNKEFAEKHAEKMREIAEKYIHEYNILKERNEKMQENINNFKIFLNTIYPNSLESFDLFDTR